MRTSLRQMGLTGVFASLSGCGTVYNATNGSAPEAASKAFSDPGPATALDGEQVALAKQLAERLALVARVVLASHDALMAAIVDGATPQLAWGLLQDQADRRINKIVGKNAEVNTLVLDLLSVSSSARWTRKTTFSHTLRLVKGRLHADSASVTTYRSELALRLAQLKQSAELTCTQPAIFHREIRSDERVELLMPRIGNPATGSPTYQRVRPAHLRKTATYDPCAIDSVQQARNGPVRHRCPET